MRTVIVLKGYPRLSETFIAQEILALEQRGLDIRIASLRHPTDGKVHPVHQQIKAPVNYLPEYLYRELGRVFRAWRKVRQWPTYKSTWDLWRRDLKRDLTPNRIRRFGQALVLAAELPEDTAHLHAHFLHTPASVTRYAALLRGLPWSCSAHAVDIWTSPAWELKEKLADCQWLVTCTRNNRRHLRLYCDDPSKIHLAYHGVDFERFEAPDRAASGRDGSQADQPVRILSVGRAVEKKGYHTLLAALAMLSDDIHWRFTHIGGGKEIKKLKRVAKTWGLDQRIEWCGSLSQDEVLGHYAAADVFVLASRVAENGDRDGLPNVLMEAQSQGLPCISTTVSAIPELIDDGVHGLLVGPDDVPGLSACISQLITSPEQRRALSATAAERLRRDFDFQHCIDGVAKRFDLPASDADDESGSSEKVA